VPPESRLPVPADQLHERIRDVLSRPDYVDAAGEPSSELAALIAKLIGWLLSALRWLFGLTQGLPEFLRWTIVGVLIVVLLLLLGHIAWSLHRAITGADVRRRDGRLVPDEQPQLQPMELEHMAEQAASRGELIEAVRLLFRASLLRLEQGEKRPFRRGTTNRQHLIRYRGTQFFDSLDVLVRTIERKWYGDEVCQQSDYDLCSQAHRSLQTALKGGVHGHAS
jgi:hypothetical protein